MAGRQVMLRPLALGSENSAVYMGSQVGDKAVVNYSYTDMPWILMSYDIKTFFQYSWALPYIVWPIRPTDSRSLCELALTPANLFCMLVHLVLIVLQLGFFLSLPVALFFPIWTVLLGYGLFAVVNFGLCTLVNGRGIKFLSDERYATAQEEHSHEQWIFVNGVAVGEAWMKSNLNRLAVTFGRPIMGIHNKTAGIIFDVIECIIQRTWTYATEDVRVCYREVKEKLYNPQYTKVVLILHSQGGIIGAMVIDWLLQELPQNLMAKLEVYTFGNAANHFNNPYRHVQSQSAAAHAAKCTEAQPRLDDQPPPDLVAETSSTVQPALSDRVIGYIEHYAHTTDFVALWGVLHFATSALSAHSLPRFIGRVFTYATPRGGHQFVQHYLDSMFPLVRDPEHGGLACDPVTGRFLGVDEANTFMETHVTIVGEPEVLPEKEKEKEDGVDEVPPHEQKDKCSAENHAVTPAKAQKKTMEVKELSRLWLYRNGRSPDPPAKRKPAGKWW